MDREAWQAVCGPQGRKESDTTEPERLTNLRWEALQIVIENRGQGARGKGVEGNTEIDLKKKKKREGVGGVAQGKAVIRNEGFH